MSSGSSVPAATPIVSIITAAYNAARLLPETVASVLAQSYLNFELIIIDDGSTDDTRAVAQRLAARDQRIRVVATPNGGQARARNTAVRTARGAYIVLLDSDDLLAPTYLASQLKLFSRFPDVAIVTPNAVNRGGGPYFDGKPLWPRTSGFERLSLRDLIEQENAVSIMSMFRREVWERVGGFNTELLRNEDYDFWLRAAIAGYAILRSFAPQAFYRRRYDSLSSDEPQMIRGVLHVLHQVDSKLDHRPEEHAALCRQIARFTRELPQAELRASLRRSDAAGAARVLRTLAVDRRSWMLAACARFSARWPQPLLWAYRIRRGIRTA